MTNAGVFETIGNALKSVSDCFKVVKDKQSETEIIKDRKRLQKAVDIAEKAIPIITKYMPLYTLEDSETFTDLLKQFRKYN